MLLSLLFLKEKQEDAALPMVSSKLSFITASIAAKEKRMVKCYNVPSAFVNTVVDEDVLMVFKGELAKMMVQIDITMDTKGTKILYVKLQKALYGLMRASLPFYRKLRKEFKDYGLVVNPYDPCVANMTTRNGSQLTVVWHVDNLMVSCVEDFEKVLCYLGGHLQTKAKHAHRKET